MSQKLKVVTIGGGSSYTPELLEGFIKRYHELPVSELWLVDVEDGKEKLDIIFELCQRMIDNAGVPMKLYKTLDRREALKDADFVTTQLRVGQLPARELDERIPLSHGYLGQETNGAGGLFKGLRTIPVIFDIVKDVEELCPNAWVINFTNPAGMVTEAVYRHTGFKRFIGVCNIPIGMKMFIRDVLMLKDSDDLSIDLFGLNHMVFIKDVLVNGKSRFAELLDGVASGQLKASSVKNIFDLPFSEGLIRSLNLLPCSYLLYYFKQKEMLAIEMGEYYKGGARAQVVQKVEKQLFELYKNPELKVKPKELEQRGGAYYSDAACEVINAIYNDKQALSYLDANLRILIAIIMCICSRRFSRLLPGLRLKRGLRCASTVSRYLTLVIYRLICAVLRDSVARFMVKRLARHCSCKCWMTQAIGVIVRWR